MENKVHPDNLSRELDPKSNIGLSEHGPPTRQSSLTTNSFSSWRVAAYAVRITMPSVRAHKSLHGTYQARRRVSNMKDDNRKSPAMASTGLRHNKRGVFTVETIVEAEKKGLKFDENGGYNELERMKQIEIIKQMPVSIAVKRQLRDKVLEGMVDFKDGICGACFNQQQANCRRCSVQCGLKWKEFVLIFSLWNTSFKTIEGYFGSGVLSYFKILKRLFFINFVLFLATFLFIVIPQLAFPSMTLTDNENTTDAVNTSIYCSAIYETSVDYSGNDWVQYILDLLQGTGFLERTVLFYGFYSNAELDLTYTSFNYKMPFAYIVVTIFVYAYSLIAMVRFTADGFRNKILTGSATDKQYSNKIFAGWDLGMNNSKNAIIKQKSIYREIQSILDEERRASERQAWSNSKLCKVWTIRILINLLVVVILCGAGYLIYYVTYWSLDVQSRYDYFSYTRVRQFLIEYMVSLTITALNAVVPIIFKRVVRWENYNTAMEVNLTLVRTVFLRLASLAVLIFTIYTQVACDTKDWCNVGTGTCSALRCWETFAGQEFYKLVITNFLTLIGVTFLWEFPRKLIVSKCDCKLSHILGLQEFDIPKHVLDLIYLQTLIWLGTLFTPLLPAICWAMLFCIFYVKMLSLLVNMVPSNKPYRAADSESFFFIVLIIAFVMCSVPIFYVIFYMTPSRGCGPFTFYTYMSSIISITLNTWPSWIQKTLDFIFGTAFIIPLLVILVLVIYYLNSMVKALKEMLKIMKEQLSLEGADKQFLLRRIEELKGGPKTSKEIGEFPKENEKLFPPNAIP